MDLQVTGNSALVTASSSGLGKASAEALAQQGANVVVNGRKSEKLADAAAEIRKTATGEVIEHLGDITDPEDVAALVERTVDEFGNLNHLVVSAGGPPTGSLFETTDEEWYKAFDLLVMSVVRLLREATPHLRAGDGGTVVTITSISVKEARPHLVLSSAVRMAVVGLGKAVSKELPPDVRVNSVLPGVYETERIQSLVNQAVERGDVSDPESGMADWTTPIPGRGAGDPAELGDVVAFLSSPRASFVNGCTIPIDGGTMDANL